MKNKKIISFLLALFLMILTVVPTTKCEAANNKPIVAVLGDSISSYEGVSVGAYPYYGPKAGSNRDFSKDKMYYYQFCNKIGANLGGVSAIGGSGFAINNGTAKFNDTQRIKQLASKGTPDIIVIYGGTNDHCNSDQEVMSGYYSTMNKVRQYYPNAVLICVSPYHYTNDGNIASRPYSNEIDFIAMCMKNYCDTDSKAVFVDLRNSLNGVFNASYDTHMVNRYEGSHGYFHPNVSGQTIIANKIYEAYFCWWYSTYMK